MRSLIILEVEHGEDTDRFDSMIAHIREEYSQRMAQVYSGRPTVLDYTVRVDVPDDCKAETIGQWGACHTHQGLHLQAEDCERFQSL